LGSQPRRTGARRGRRRGPGRGRNGGEGGASEGEDERRDIEERRREQIYRKARRSLSGALRRKDYSYAAEVATSVTISRASSRDVVSLFLAGVKAFSEGEEQRWEPEPESLAAQGIRYAYDNTSYELTLEGKQLLNNILTANLRAVRQKKARK